MTSMKLVVMIAISTFEFSLWGCGVAEGGKGTVALEGEAKVVALEFFEAGRDQGMDLRMLSMTVGGLSCNLFRGRRSRLLSLE